MKKKGRGNPDDDFLSLSVRKEKESAVEPSEPLIDEPIVTDVTEDREPDGQELPTVKKELPAAKTARTALEKIHDKLRDKGELVKLLLKHYHMSTVNFKKRTSALQIPKDIYAMCEDVVTSCASCQKHAPAPTRSKVTGMRAVALGG